MGNKEKTGKPAYIISDEPFGIGSSNENHVGFRFDAYAETLAELIAFKENKTPLVIGIYGSWGSGKTSLMKMVEERLQEYSKKDEKYRVCKSVWFQPWKHTGEEAILAALAEAIFRAMEEDGFFDQGKTYLESLSQSLDKKEILSAFSKALSRGVFDISKFFGELPHKKKLGFYHLFESLLADLIWCYVRDRPKTSTSEGLEDKEGVLAIFIDDLDRCPPKKIPQVLETIKLFMNQPGCVFVIGVDKEIVESAIADQGYKDKKAEFFMQKMVQVTFDLPAKSIKDIEDYLEKLAPDQPLLSEHSGMISKALDYNPRGAKRFLNNLSLRQSLLSKLVVEIDQKDLDKALVRWAVLEIAYHGFVQYARKEPEAIQQVQGFIEEQLKKGEITLDDWRLKDEMLEGLNQSIHRFVRDREFIELVREFPSKEKVIKSVVELSETLGKPKEFEPEKTEKDYKPDAMVTIPKGTFLYGDAKVKKTIDHDFKIDIYPVTNERFGWFIADKGYEKKDFWSDEGWEWREKNKIAEPKHWNDSEWNQPDHPIVGVSSYEAEAFAKWEGKRLPTELEWERAARGTEGWKYPWGDEFDKEKCNSAESEIGKTTPVTRYANGLSPERCYDMAGNVWEWTADVGIIRGGSWYGNSDFVRCAIRYHYFPYDRYNNIGFRCAQ